MTKKAVLCAIRAAVIGGAIAFSASVAGGPPPTQSIQSVWMTYGTHTDLGLQSIEGGSISAPVNSQPATAEYYYQKFIGPPKYGAITAQMGFGRALDELDLWINSTWNGDFSAVDLEFHEVNNTKYWKASESVIAETVIPTLDRTSIEPGFLTVSFTPQNITKIKTTPRSIPADVARPWLRNGFSLEIDGIGKTVVTRIESFSVSRSGSKVAFPNLKIGVAKAHAQSWLDWHRDFVVNGLSDQAHERDGTLKLIDANGKVAVVIQLSNVGIFKVTEPLGTNADVVVELYVEKMSFDYVH